MTRKRQIKSPTPIPAGAFFLNPETESGYAPDAGTNRTDIIIPTLNWRSKLTHITPRIAQHMIFKGTNLIKTK